jgi:hypothetical protein
MVPQPGGSFINYKQNRQQIRNEINKQEKKIYIRFKTYKNYCNFNSLESVSETCCESKFYYSVISRKVDAGWIMFKVNK